MKTFTYVHPNTITKSPELKIFNEDNEQIGYCQRVYANKLTKLLDYGLEHKYFVNYEARLVNQPIVHCKKISRKGRIFYKAYSIDTAFEIGYTGWRDLIPDLQITNGDVEMMLHKEIDDWSVFEWQNVEYARWRALYLEEEDVFSVELQIEDIAPIDNPAFYIAIAQCVLFIGA